MPSKFFKAAYFLFQGPIKNRGSDSVIRGFMSSIGRQLTGKPMRLPQDVDIQSYARSQKDFTAWLTKALQHPEAGTLEGMSSKITTRENVPQAMEHIQINDTTPITQTKTQQTNEGQAIQPSGNSRIPTAKENPHGTPIPNATTINVRSVEVLAQSKLPGYAPSENDALSLVSDAFHSGKFSKNHVASASFDPKTGQWSIGENSGVPKRLSPEVEAWIQSTQEQVKAGQIHKERWEPGNCSEPNTLNHSTMHSSPGLNDKIVYTFELRKIRVNPNTPKEWRVFYKEPCAYCETLKDQGVKLPRLDKKDD